MPICEIPRVKISKDQISTLGDFTVCEDWPISDHTLLIELSFFPVRAPEDSCLNA